MKGSILWTLKRIGSQPRISPGRLYGGIILDNNPIKYIPIQPFNGSIPDRHTLQSWWLDSHHNPGQISASCPEESSEPLPLMPQKPPRPACSTPLLSAHSHFDIGHDLDRAWAGSAETSELGSLQASAAPGSWLLQYRQKETSSNTTICWVGKMHKDSLTSEGKRELWAFQRRAADLLQLEAFLRLGLRPLATLLTLVSQASCVGFWSPMPEGVLKLGAQ